MRVIALDELGPAEWDTAVRESGAPFRFSHRADAGEAFTRAYDSYSFRPQRAEFEDGTTLLFPFISVHRRISSLSMLIGMPLSLEGSPIAIDGTPRAEHIQALFRANGGHGHLSIYGGAGGSPPAAGEVEELETHVLDLSPGFDALWETSFTAKTRNVCRKAEREGVEVALADASEANEYRALYERASRSWGYDEPPYPRPLFGALLTTANAELWLARRDGQTIAGALLLRGSHDLFYWSGAMDRDYAHVAPGNAVLRTVIESACERGIGYLDFGASAGLPRVEAFKRSFGATAVSYTATTLESRRYRAAEHVRRRAEGAKRS